MALALVCGGCGSASTHARFADTSPGPATLSTGARAHPQLVDPQAGQIYPALGTSTGAGAARTASIPDGMPRAPASATRAASTGTLSDAEIRAELDRFRAVVARYHLDQLNLAGALLSPAQLPPGPFQTSVASVFTDYGLPIACGGVLRVPMLGVANKTLPCGTQVIFRYGGRAIRVPVIDRGPYIAGRDWDFTGAAAQALRFPGLGYVEWQLG